MATATPTKTVDLQELNSLQETLKDKVLSGEIPPELLRWFIELGSDERNALTGDAEDESEQMPAAILKIVSKEPLTIAATDGTATIPNAGDVFTGYIDPDFKGWGADEASDPTPEMKTVVREMVQNATFVQMFGSLSAETEKLCMTQSQIIAFVKTHRQYLRTDGCATFFPFKSKGKFFVASVLFVDLGRLEVRVYRLEYDAVWLADNLRRVVVPQL